MALSNTHSLGTGISYLDDTQLIAELLTYERYIDVPYADTATPPKATIGIGVNITESAHMALVLDQLGVLSAYIDSINTDRAANKPPISPLTTAEVNVIYESIVSDFEAVVSSHPISGNGTAGTSLSEEALQKALNDKMVEWFGAGSKPFSVSDTQAKAITKRVGVRSCNHAYLF